MPMSCRVGELSLSIIWFVRELFFVSELLFLRAVSASCMSVSCRITLFNTFHIFTSVNMVYYSKQGRGGEGGQLSCSYCQVSFFFVLF